MTPAWLQFNFDPAGYTHPSWCDGALAPWWERRHEPTVRRAVNRWLLRRIDAPPLACEPEGPDGAGALVLCSPPVLRRWALAVGCVLLRQRLRLLVLRDEAGSLRQALDGALYAQAIAFDGLDAAAARLLCAAKPSADQVLGIGTLGLLTLCCADAPRLLPRTRLKLARPAASGNLLPMDEETRKRGRAWLLHQGAHETSGEYATSAPEQEAEPCSFA